MQPALKRVVNCAILTLILAIAGVLVSHFYPSLLDRSSLTILLLAFFVISSATLAIVSAGENRSPDSASLFSLAGVGTKFILAAVTALLYFRLFKKSGMNNILLFFVLYLTFTIYVIAVIVKMLKIRSLKNDQF